MHEAVVDGLVTFVITFLATLFATVPAVIYGIHRERKSQESDRAERQAAALKRSLEDLGNGGGLVYLVRDWADAIAISVKTRGYVGLTTGWTVPPSSILRWWIDRTPLDSDYLSYALELNARVEELVEVCNRLALKPLSPLESKGLQDAAYEVAARARSLKRQIDRDVAGSDVAHANQ